MATPALDTTVSFSSTRQIASFDPSECPVTIIGKLANLKKIQYADVANKFTPIDDKVFFKYFLLDYLGQSRRFYHGWKFLMGVVKRTK